MPFNQTEYISNFNKNNYKMYQFRVKKSDINIINYLDNIENRNSYIVSLITTDISSSIYTIKEIKSIIKPILNKYGINEGEAKGLTFCRRGFQFKSYSCVIKRAISNSRLKKKGLLDPLEYYLKR